MREVIRRNDTGDDLFDRVVGTFFTPMRLMNTAPSIEEGTLALDISETDEEVIVRASLPGFERKDVEVDVHDGVLSIRAMRDEQSEERQERFYRRERRVGSVSRRVALPGGVDGQRATARLRDGVLEVRVPRSPEATPKRLSIE